MNLGMSGELLEALGSAVLHFVWQGALVGVVAGVVLGMMRRASSGARYAVACAALGACALLFLGTLWMGIAPMGSAGGAVAELPREVVVALSGGGVVERAEAQLLTVWIAWVWLGGVVLFGVRFGLHWLSARHLTRSSVSAVRGEWLEIFEGLKRELGVCEGVRLLRSGLAASPMVVGWIAPVVLIPVSAFTTLTPEQLRAVLVHELAHIRRHDHIVNALQFVIETVLFFHPVTWWLSRRIRVEREHCCDDAAVRSSSSARVFAEALANLETMRMSMTRATLAATGGPLMDRIARILGTRAPKSGRMGYWRTIVALAAGGVVAIAGITHAAGTEFDGEREPVIEMLRQASQSGVSEEQLRTMYDRFVYEGSELQAEVERAMAAFEQRLAESLQRGDLTPEAAEEKLAYYRTEIDEKLKMTFLMEVHGLSELDAKHKVMIEEIEEAAVSGEITRDEADAKLADLARGIDLRRLGEQERERIGAEIKAAVDAGELTHEEGVERYNKEVREMDDSLRLRGAQAEFDDLVERGLITRELAEEKLADFRRELAMERVREIDWAAIEARVEAAVEHGDMTREEAERMYEGMKRRMEEFKHERHDELEEEELHVRITGGLREGGLERGQIRPTMGAMRKVVAEIEREGNSFELDPNMERYLSEELGLSDEQVGLVVEISLHLAAMDDDDDNDDRPDGPGPDEDGDVELTLDQVPADIRAAILKHAKGRGITEIERAPDGSYEVEVGDREFLLSPSGEFLGEEDDF